MSDICTHTPYVPLITLLKHREDRTTLFTENRALAIFCTVGDDDNGSAAAAAFACRYAAYCDDSRSPVVTPPPAESDVVAEAYPVHTPFPSDDEYVERVAYDFGGAAAAAADTTAAFDATPAVTAGWAGAEAPRRHGMAEEAPVIEPRTGDLVMHSVLQSRANVTYYSKAKDLAASRQGRPWRSLLPPGWHPRAVKFWVRLRIGQVPASYTPEDVAVMVEALSGAQAMHVAVQPDSTGLFMVWVLRRDEGAVLALLRAFVCDLHGVWAVPCGAPQLPQRICHDGVFRAGVAKCPITVERPHGRDRMWD